MPQVERIRAEAPQKLKVRCALTDVFVRDVAVSAVFFYERKLDTAALSRGLAQVLGDFAPFNARLRRKGLDHFIECGSTGASFSVKHSARSLRETIAQLDDRRRVELVEPIDARAAWTSDTPVLACRVTHFSDGSSALGVTAHHTVGDWSSVVALLKAWSRAVAGLDWEKPILVEDRDAYLNGALPPTAAAPNLRYARILELSKLGAYMLTKARDKRRVTLGFEPDELTRMRDTFQAESGRRLSTNDAINAHVCSVISARDVRPRDRGIAIAVNFRPRAELPSNVLGNMVTTVESRCAWGTPTNQVAADLRTEVDQFVDKYLNHRANLDYVRNHGGVKKLTRFIPNAIDPFSGSLLISNWHRFGHYEIDFGGAAPSHYITASTGPLPWLGVIHEGLGNRGLIVDLELPSAVAARMLDAEGQQALHKFREADMEAPTKPKWLC
jgi:hypothetical protein